MPYLVLRICLLVGCWEFLVGRLGLVVILLLSCPGFVVVLLLSCLGFVVVLLLFRLGFEVIFLLSCLYPL